MKTTTTSAAVDAAGTESTRPLSTDRAAKKVKTLFGWLIFRRLSLPLSLLVARTPVRPWMVTSLGLLTGLTGAVFLGVGTATAIAVGAVLAFIAKLLDAMDGEVARAKNLDTARGYVADGLVDRLRDTCVIIGAGVGLHRMGDPSALLWTLPAVAGYLGFFYVSGAAPSHWREAANDGEWEEKHMFRVTEKVRLGAGDTLAVTLLVAALTQHLDWWVAAVAIVAPVAIVAKLRRLFRQQPWLRAGS